MEAHMILRKIAVDLGTSNTRIYENGRGVVLNEPSLVTVNTNANRVVRIGEDAESVKGKAPDSEETVRPLSNGVISRYRHTLIMLKKFLKKSCGNLVIRPDMTVCVPCGISDVEEHAVKDVCSEAGAKNVLLIDSPLAAAIGAGIDVTSSTGNLIIDIGGGTTDIAVICSGGVVCSDSVKTGGFAMNESIIKYVRRKYLLAISETSAERAKLKAGAVWGGDTSRMADVRGKCLQTSTPRSVTLTCADMVESLEEPVTSVIEALCGVLEQTPPELISDISKSGILLVGGGSKIYGIDKLISSVTGVPCRIAENPETRGVVGAGRAADLGLRLGAGTLSRYRTH